MGKSMSELGITGITVSVEIADKSYGAGQTSFMAISSKLPEGTPGLPWDTDAVIGDGMDKYFAAWQTLLQAALASGQLTQAEYVEQTQRFLTRIKKVRALYKKLVERQQ